MVVIYIFKNKHFAKRYINKKGSPKTPKKH